MKIRVLSDLHTEGFLYKYNRLDEDVLVLAGDIGVGSRVVAMIKETFPKDLPIVFVAGNHEYYHNNFEELNSLFAREFRNTNVHWINNSSWEYQGVQFLGGTMHSDFKLFGENESVLAKQDSRRGINDFHCIRTGNDRAWTVEDCIAEFDKFEKYMKYTLSLPYSGKRVVVSHFCPSLQSVHPRFQNSNITPFFTSNCEHLMGFSDLWLHGHTHDSYDYQLHGTRVVCNPRGYGHENLEGFKPNLIVEI